MDPPEAVDLATAVNPPGTTMSCPHLKRRLPPPPHDDRQTHVAVAHPRLSPPPVEKRETEGDERERSEWER